MIAVFFFRNYAGPDALVRAGERSSPVLHPDTAFVDRL